MKRAYLLSLSAIENDPRVRRMGDALHAAGWRVTGFGLSGGDASSPDWPVKHVELDAEGDGGAVSDKGLTVLFYRAVLGLGAGLMLPVRAALGLARSPWAQRIADVRALMTDETKSARAVMADVTGRLRRGFAEARLEPAERLRQHYWRYSPYLEKFKEHVERIEEPGLWIANDWMMLPIASIGKKTAGGEIAYDSHEFAVEQFSENAEWRQFSRPVVEEVERRHVGEAAVVTAVSPSIVEHIAARYAAKARTFTLRNVPPLQSVPARPVGETVRILYHGLCAPGRGLEMAIESVARLDDRFHLSIRGPFETAAYEDRMRALARSVDGAGRIDFLPAVPMVDLVREAAAFDIGIAALPDISLQKRFSLPNKVFEYMMAGLALAVSDLPELRRLIEETGAGVLIENAEPDAIAKALNALDRDAIEALRANALKASRLYNYHAQSAPVLAAYEELRL